MSPVPIDEPPFNKRTAKLQDFIFFTCISALATVVLYDTIADRVWIFDKWVLTLFVFVAAYLMMPIICAFENCRDQRLDAPAPEDVALNA
jgi:hypothetical protein